MKYASNAFAIVSYFIPRSKFIKSASKSPSIQLYLFKVHYVNISLFENNGILKKMTSYSKICNNHN